MTLMENRSEFYSREFAAHGGTSYQNLVHAAIERGVGAIKAVIEKCRQSGDSVIDELFIDELFSEWYLGQQPLHWAASAGRCDVCKAILEAVSSEKRFELLTSIAPSGHFTAREFAARLGRDQCVSTLQEQWVLAEMEPEIEQARDLVVNLDVDGLRDFLANAKAVDLLVSRPTKAGYTLFHYVVWYGNIQMTKLMLAAVSDKAGMIAAKTRDGQTALDLTESVCSDWEPFDDFDPEGCATLIKEALVDLVIPEDNICPICYEELKNTVKTHCSHEFCFDCLDQWKEFGGWNCPLCREAL